jgi:hypothetical protein
VFPRHRRCSLPAIMMLRFHADAWRLVEVV